MTTETIPDITSQAALREAWIRLMGPFGYAADSLWLLIVQADDRPIPTLTEIAELPALPPDDAADAWAEVLGGVMGPGERAAFLLSRPGSGGLTGADRRWASVLYAACRLAGVACETVHRADDSDVLPIPLDDLGTDGAG